MIDAPKPGDETPRLDAPRTLNILDTEPEERFDRITRLAVAAADREMFNAKRARKSGRPDLVG